MCTPPACWFARVRAIALPWLALVSMLGAPTARADDPEALRFSAAPRFVSVEGAEAIAHAACSPGKIAREVLHALLQGFAEQTDLDPELAVVLTSGPLVCGDLFYVPLENDVRGIGYQHEDPRELFDDTPDARLQGVAFLNDWPYWRDHDAEFSRAWNHELGHRWGARVRVLSEGMPSEALLGRAHTHWSYFLDSGGSPLEGNRFVSSEGERFATDTALSDARFSPLDLYLMGVLAPEEVAPFALLQPRNVDTVRDCAGEPLRSESPPQVCEPVSLSAARIQLTIEDVIAAEGPRSPAARNQARELDLAVLVLRSDAQTSLTAHACAELSDAIDQRLLDFEHASGGRMRLRNITQADGDCSHFAASAPSDAAAGDAHEASGGCSALGHRGGRGGRGWLLWPIVLWVLRAVRASTT